ncbi:unnamed protein product [Peniophora sp. CBMAI 1063]|nr:unnamed protein product [Peniophora sp. CBMAI 1063]
MAKISTTKARRQRRVVNPDNVKPPRPLNKFFLFKQAFVADWPEPKPENKVMVKAAGDAWKNLPPSEIAHWTRVQEEAAMEHARLYPNYKYEPAKRGEKTAARARARRKRAEDTYDWDTPSLRASSLESSPASSSVALYHPHSEPASPTPPIRPIEPELWVPPTGGPNDEEYIHENTLSSLPEFAIETFETQVQEPVPTKQQDDWAQYIDPDLLAMDEYDGYSKDHPAPGELDDSGLDVQPQTDRITASPLLSPRPMTCIDPSLL